MPTSWWQQTFDYARQIYTLTKSSTRHDTEIKELQRQVKELTTGMQLLAILNGNRIKKRPLKTTKFWCYDLKTVCFGMIAACFRQQEI